MALSKQVTVFAGVGQACTRASPSRQGQARTSTYDVAYVNRATSIPHATTSIEHLVVSNLSNRPSVCKSLMPTITHLFFTLEKSVNNSPTKWSKKLALGKFGIDLWLRGDFCLVKSEDDAATFSG